MSVTSLLGGDIFKLRETPKALDTAHGWKHTWQHQGNDLGDRKNSKDKNPTGIQNGQSAANVYTLNYLKKSFHVR